MVAIVASNWDNLTPVVFGSLYLGCTVIGIDQRSHKCDMKRMLSVTQPSLVFCDIGGHELARECLDELGNGSKIFTFGGQVNESEPVECLLMECGDEGSFV